MSRRWARARAPVQRASAVRGWALRTSGLVLRIGAIYVGLLFWFRFVDRPGLSSWPSIVGHLFAMYGIVQLFHLGRLASRRGRRHLNPALSSPEDIGDGPFVLYLRPFADDMTGAEMEQLSRLATTPYGFLASTRTLEEGVARLFRRVGPLIAVGRPGEDLPFAGARRFYLPLDDWQDTVRQLMLRARLVVLVTGPGPGTVWEFVEASRLLPPSRLLLAVFHDPPVYEEFRRAVASSARLRLPDYPGLAYPKRATDGTRDYALRGVITFDSGGHARFLRFDPTRRRPRIGRSVTGWAVRWQLRPVLRAVKAEDDAGAP